MSKFGHIFRKIKYIKNQSCQNMLIIKVNCPFLYSSMKKKNCKDSADFWHRKIKNEFCYVWPSIPNQSKHLEPFYWRFHRPLA